MTPLWIDRLLRDSQALNSFMEEIAENEARLNLSIFTSIKANKVDEARVDAGELNAWKTLKQRIRTYEREEEQNAIIQEQTAR